MKKKSLWTRIMVILLTLLLAIPLLAHPTVSAAGNELGDGPRYYGEDTAYTWNSGNMALQFKLRSNNSGSSYVPVFCLEPGVPTPSSFNYFYAGIDLIEQLEVNHKLSTMSATVMAKRIGVAIRRGWKEQAQTLNNWMSTQLAIWGIITNDYSGHSVLQNGTPVASIINTGKAIFDYAMSDKTVTPSFDGQTLSLAVGESVVLTDSNGIVTRLLAEKGYQLNVEKQHVGDAFSLTLLANHQLKVSLKSATGNLSVFQNLVGTDPTTLMAYTENVYQDLILGSVQVDDPANLRFSIQLATGDIAFTKTNPPGVPFTDARFELRDAGGVAMKFSQESSGVYSANASGTITSLMLDASGKLVMKAVEPGVYSIVETVWPAATKQASPVSVTVVSGQTAAAAMSNTLIQGRIRVTKTDRNTNANLAGAVFTVSDKATGAVVATLTTGADGTATTGLLNYGVYTVKEVTAPTGYMIDPANVEDVTIDQNLETVTFSVSNQMIQGRIQVIKKDRSTNANLAGAVFTVASKATGAVVATLTTGTDGTATSALLNYGAYTVREITPPNGYVLDLANVQDISINQNLETVTFSVSNALIQGRIKVVKQDRSSSAKLAGAVFTVTRKDSGALVETLTTGIDGTATTAPLDYGAYIVKETEAPIGYVLDPANESELFVAENLQTYSYTASNKIIEGYIALSKTDSKTGQAIEGVVYEVSNAAGTVLSTLTTDALGQAKTVLLPYGIYTVKEVKGAASYILNTNRETVNIDVEGETEAKSFTNTQQLFGLRFQKQDLMNGIKAVGEASLAGAEFTVTVEALVRTGITGQKQTGETVGVYTTNAKGEFTIGDLPLGIYKIQESKAPLGYQLNPNPIYVRGMVQVEGAMTSGFPKLVSESEMRALVENSGAGVVAAQSELVYYTDHSAALVTAANQAVAKVELVKNSLLHEAEIGTLVLSRVSSTLAGTDGLIPLANLGIYGRIELSKHADNHNPDTEESALNSGVKEPEIGVEFQIIDAAGAVLETLTTNDQGKAASGLLPYGNYSLHQVAGTGSHPTLLPIEDLDFSISKNGEVLSFVAENQALRMRVQVSKFDEKTQKAIVQNGATFEIFRSDDSQVVMYGYYPNPGRISEFTTNSEGNFETPGRLLPGDYYLVETKAPTGYHVIQGHRIPFTVPTNLPTDQAVIIDVRIGADVEQMVGVDVPNTAQYGKLTIHKTAEQFDHWTQEKVKVLVPESGPLAQPIATADPTEPREIKSEVQTEVVTGGRVVITGLYEGVVEETFAARTPSATTAARPLPTSAPAIISAETGSAVPTETTSGVPSEGTGESTTMTTFASTETSTERTEEIPASTEATSATEGGSLSGGSSMHMSPVAFDRTAAKGETLKIVGQAGSEKVDLTLVFGETASPITLKAGQFDLTLAGITTRYYVQTTALVTLTQTKESKTETVMVPNPKYVEDAESANETTTILEGALVEKEFSVNKPVYISKILAGVGFELIAAEDILSYDGQSKLFNAGDVVKSGTTAIGAELVFTDIPLGKYRLAEKSAPSGYLLDPSVYEVAFTPAEQSVLFTLKNTGEIVNQRQILNVKMNKTMVATPLFHHENGALKDVTFGVYTNESVQGLAKDSLIAVVKPATQADPAKGIAIGDMIVKDLLPGSYYFKELSTNGNYLLNEDNFLIKVSYVEGQTESVTTTAEPVTNAPKTGELLLSKADVETGEWLTGARFAIYGLTNEGSLIPVLNNAGENVWAVDENGQLSWADLEMGKYRFIETAAPVGYVSAKNPLDIDVTENDTVTRVTFNNSPSEISILKIDKESEEALAGVALELYDQSGTLIDKWTSTTEAHVIKRLVVGGTYVLGEINTVAGYATREDVSFTVKDEVMVQGVVMSNTKTTVAISKQDATTGTELPGASMKLTDAEGKTVVAWISSEVPFIIRGLEVGKTYTLHEDLAPLGYAVASRIDFTITDTEAKQEVVMVDELTTAAFSKQDGTTGAELPGASMKITDKDGKTVDEWISGDTPHIVRGLHEGVTYTLYEDLAPLGYATASSISFTMGDGKKVTMIDEVITVELSKKDATTGAELPGASMKLTDEQGKVVHEWTSSDTPQLITKLAVGKTYTLYEDLAPLGYAVASSVSFTIRDTGEVQRVEMIDELTKVVLEKSDATDGKPVPGAEITVYDENGKEVFKGLTDEEGKTRITGLQGGKTYTFKESIHPYGYALNKNTFTFKLNKDGSVEGTTKFSDEPTRFEIKKSDDKGHAMKDVGFQLFTDAGVKIYWTLQDGIWIADANGAHDTVMSSRHGDIFMHYLPVGKYVLKESFTPNGYTAAADRTIDLSAEHGTSTPLQITVKNLKKPEPIAPILPRTGENDPLTPMALLVGGLAIVLSAGLLRHKIRRQSGYRKR